MAATSTRKRATGTEKAVSVVSSSKEVTFEVVKPFCGLEIGERRKVTISEDIKETERLGYIKFI